MKILQIHNKYLSGNGGEDYVVEAEREMLQSHDHCVYQYFDNNNNLEKSIPLINGLNCIWSKDTYIRIIDLINKLSPDIVHVHNSFARISPSVFWACRKKLVPCIWTLHNYRSICSTSLLMRNGTVCVECVGRLPYPAIVHRCKYNNSIGAGLAITGTNFFHNIIGTYKNIVSRFIALTEFSKGIYVRSGFPDSKIDVKPNFLKDNLIISTVVNNRKNQVVFVGQINEAKGIDILINIWTSNIGSNLPNLVIVGDGPLCQVLKNRTMSCGNIEWVGRVDHVEAISIISDSLFCLLPSRWYEGFPMVVVESMMMGTPCICPSRGSYINIISDGFCGYLVPENSEACWIKIIKQALSLPFVEWKKISDNCRNEYLGKYTPKQNYEILLNIYSRAIMDYKISQNSRGLI